MKNITQHTGTLEMIKRLPQSENGNPRYLVRLDGFECRTAPDDSLGYSLPNHFDKEITAHIGTHYGKPTICNVRRA